LIDSIDGEPNGRARRVRELFVNWASSLTTNRRPRTVTAGQKIGRLS
jgi:hypothetical protein